MARKTAVTDEAPVDDEELKEPEDLADDAPEDLDHDDDAAGDDDDDLVADLEDGDVDEGETIPGLAAAAGTTEAPEAPEEVEEEEEDDEGDVEASLDVILKERLVQVDEEEDEDEPNDPEDRAAPEGAKVLPKQPKEFVCQSCFLVKHPSQMADHERQLCRDCV